MFYDYLLLVSVCSAVFRWALNEIVTPDTAALLIGVAVISIGILRIFGSRAFHERTRFRKAIFAAVGFAVSFAQGDLYSALILTVLIFLIALIPFGLYVMMSSEFADARRDPQAHGSKIARIGIVVVVFAILMIAAAPYLEGVIPKWNVPDAFLKADRR